MANEFPKLSEVFKIGTEVTYDEAIEKVFLPQDNAVKSIPSISPIETVTLTGNKIVPTAFLVQVKTVEELSNELHFIDYTNLRDGAILQLRILDNNNPIVIKNGISGVGSIMTADGNDIELNDYRTIVQLQLEGTLWRQVGGIQAQADWNQVDSKKPDFIKNKPTNLLDSTRITNCITQIPEDIKLELNDGVLTLKAGSKVYVPNGFEDDGVTPIFDEVTISSDLTVSIADNYKEFIFYNYTHNELWFSPEPDTRSGTTNPSDLWGFFYNTSYNKVYYLRNTSSPDNLTFSLPIALVNSTASGFTSIDQTFNGFGYIGSTVFVLPGVKGLIPNGRNINGTLKNIEYVTSEVIVRNDMGINTSYDTTLNINDYFNYGIYTLGNDNYLSSGYGSKLKEFVCGTFSTDSSGKITSFTPKLPFRAADYSEVEIKQDKATAVNYGNITNCITEIPQDIKLELNNGTLTLKAGSKVYVPNGFEDGLLKFDEVVIESDVSIHRPWNDTRMLFIRHNSDTDKYIEGYPVGQCHSGSTAPTGTQWMFWYDTSSNIIKCTNNSGATWDNYYAFPICIFTADTEGITSIDQVFNGLGYIGNTIFALPGVKMLVPWGRNEDGSLRNVEKTTNKVVINTNPNDVNDAVICLNDTSINSFYLGFTKPVFGWATHQEDENKNYLSTVETDYCFVGRLQGDSNKKITDFKPKLPFRAVDQSSLNNFVLVSALPTNPDSNTFYFIPE